MKSFGFFIVITITVLLLSCTMAEPESTESTIVADQIPSREAVSLVEKYFRAVGDGSKGEATALLARLVDRKVESRPKDLDTNRLSAIQPVHFDWFTYFRDEGFKLERVVVLEANDLFTYARAYCYSPVGESRIPQVAEFKLVQQDGVLLIREIHLNFDETLREAKKRQSS